MVYGGITGYVNVWYASILNFVKSDDLNFEISSILIGRKCLIYRQIEFKR